LALTVAGKRVERSSDTYRRSQFKKQRSDAPVKSEEGGRIVYRDPETGRITSTKLPEAQEVAARQTAELNKRKETQTRSTGVNPGGVQQIPGLQTQTTRTPQQETQRQPNVIREQLPPRNEGTLQRFDTALRSGSPIGLVEIRETGNVAERAVAGFLLGTGEPLKGGTEFVRTRVENVFQPGINPDAIKIIGAVRGFQKEPVKKIDEAYGASGQVLQDLGSELQTVGGAAEIGGQVALFEAGGRYAARKFNPEITTSLETTSRTRTVKGKPVVGEVVSSSGVTRGNNILGNEVKLQVDAVTEAKTFVATKPTRKAPGTSFQEQATTIRLRGNNVEAQGSLRTDLTIETLGKRTRAEGEFGGGVSGFPKTGQKLEISGDIRNYSQPFKTVLEQKKTVYSKKTSSTDLFEDSGINELKFPLNKPVTTYSKVPVKGTASVAEAFVTDAKVSRLGVDEKAFGLDSAFLELEKGKYTRSFNKEFGVDNKIISKESFAQKTYPISQLTKDSVLSEQIVFNTQIKGKGFTVQSPVEISRDVGSVRVTDTFKKTFGEGTNKPKGIVNTAPRKEISIKGYDDYIDLNKALGVPESNTFKKTFTFLEKGKGGEGTLNKPFETQSYDLTVIGRQRTSPAKITYTGVESTSEAAVKTASSAVVKEIIKEQNKAVASTSAKVVAVGYQGFRSKEKVVVDYGRFDNYESYKPTEKVISDFKLDVSQERKPKSKVDQEFISSLDIDTKRIGRTVYRDRTAQENEVSLRITPAIIPVIDLERKPAQEFVLETKPAQETKSLLDTAQNVRAPSFFYTPRTPNLVFPGSRGKLLSEGEFLVEVGKPGNKYYFNLGVGGKDLVERGATLARNTAAASIKVTPVVSSRGFDVRSIVPRGFDLNKEGRFIQSVPTRISSSGEKSQIPGEAQRKRLSKNSEYGKSLSLINKGVPLRVVRFGVKRGFL